MEKYKVGILRETKTPPDRRVAIPPKQAVELLKKFQNVEIFVQPSDIRAYSDQEYKELGLSLQEDLTNCDILIGVKEVKISALIPNKTYMFFSHTAKKQVYNRNLLQAIIANKIKLIDYEYLTDIQGIRLVAFGRWAGIIGAYNAILGYGIRTGMYQIQRAHECHDMDEFFAELDKVKLPNLKLLISGGGRVAHGAMEVLDHLDIKKVSPQDFLRNSYDQPVYAQIDPWHYVRRKDGDQFDLEHFAKHPVEYESTFLPFSKVTDVFIACHFWDPQSPVFMTLEDMQAPDFKMKLIADVSCDVHGPIPSTLRASTINEPFYGFDPKSGKESDAFDKNNITIMAVDNLPGEAPRNASISFANDLIDKVMPSLFGNDPEDIIKRASITSLEGNLTERFSYLENFLAGK
ncbi:MAG: NAD(P)-dependent oxidoreductase [Bacteroidales bacterium]|nr:NAD(P)-dependent oxidoreductase [Bacteroidales bacterium]